MVNNCVSCGFRAAQRRAGGAAAPPGARGNPRAARRVHREQAAEGPDTMKGIVAWLIGIPIPIIIVLYLFDVF